MWTNKPGSTENDNIAGSLELQPGSTVVYLIVRVVGQCDAVELWHGSSLVTVTTPNPLYLFSTFQIPNIPGGTYVLKGRYDGEWFELASLVVTREPSWPPVVPFGPSLSYDTFREAFANVTSFNVWSLITGGWYFPMHDLHRSYTGPITSSDVPPGRPDMIRRKFSDATEEVYADVHEVKEGNNTILRKKYKSSSLELAVVGTKNSIGKFTKLNIIGTLNSAIMSTVVFDGRTELEVMPGSAWTKQFYDVAVEYYERDVATPGFGGHSENLKNVHFTDLCVTYSLEGKNNSVKKWAGPLVTFSSCLHSLVYYASPVYR